MLIATILIATIYYTISNVCDESRCLYITYKDSTIYRKNYTEDKMLTNSPVSNCISDIVQKGVEMCSASCKFRDMHSHVP